MTHFLPGTVSIAGWLVILPAHRSYWSYHTAVLYNQKWPELLCPTSLLFPSAFWDTGASAVCPPMPSDYWTSPWNEWRRLTSVDVSWQRHAASFITRHNATAPVWPALCAAIVIFMAGMEGGYQALEMLNKCHIITWYWHTCDRDLTDLCSYRHHGSIHPQFSHNIQWGPSGGFQQSAPPSPPPPLSHSVMKGNYSLSYWAL